MDDAPELENSKEMTSRYEQRANPHQHSKKLYCRKVPNSSWLDTKDTLQGVVQNPAKAGNRQIAVNCG